MKGVDKMSFIMVKHITKTFKVSEKRNTKFATLKNFFNRKYKYIKAIDDISFSIKKGEIVGYIGPNGAGKSTTIKILSGILYPDSGTVIVDNMVPYVERKKYVSQIGVVFGQRSQLWWDVPAIDSFKLLKDIYKIDDESFNETLNELINTLNLKDIINIPVRQLSLGSRMRLEIAAALLHRPKILFLDEPTIVLDAVSKIAVREFIKIINRENKTTVLLTTHDMQDIEALTERILLIGKGRILLDGYLSELKTRNSTHKTMTVDYIGEKLPISEYMTVTKNISGHAEIIIDTAFLTVSQAISHISSKVEVKDISITGETVDEMVVSLYKEFEI